MLNFSFLAQVHKYIHEEKKGSIQTIIYINGHKIFNTQISIAPIRIFLH